MAGNRRARSLGGIWVTGGRELSGIVNKGGCGLGILGYLGKGQYCT